MLSPLRSLMGTDAQRFSCLFCAKFVARHISHRFGFGEWQDVLHSLAILLALVHPTIRPSPLYLHNLLQRSSTRLRNILSFLIALYLSYIIVEFALYYLTWQYLDVQAGVDAYGFFLSLSLAPLIAWVVIKSNLFVLMWRNIVQSLCCVRIVALFGFTARFVAHPSWEKNLACMVY